MLLSGEIDAAIALAGLDPAQVRTVIPDADAAAAAWSRRTGVYPVNHVVVREGPRCWPNIPGWRDELMRLFAASKRRRATERGWPTALPSSC